MELKALLALLLTTVIAFVPATFAKEHLRKGKKVAAGGAPFPNVIDSDWENAKTLITDGWIGKVEAAAANIATNGKNFPYHDYATHGKKFAMAAASYLHSQAVADCKTAKMLKAAYFWGYFHDAGYKEAVAAQKAKGDYSKVVDKLINDGTETLGAWKKLGENHEEFSIKNARKALADDAGLAAMKTEDVENHLGQWMVAHTKMFAATDDVFKGKATQNSGLDPQNKLAGTKAHACADVFKSAAHQGDFGYLINAKEGATALCAQMDCFFEFVNYGGVPTNIMVPEDGKQVNEKAGGKTFFAQHKERGVKTTGQNADEKWDMGFGNQFKMFWAGQEGFIGFINNMSFGQSDYARTQSKALDTALTEEKLALITWENRKVLHEKLPNSFGSFCVYNVDNGRYQKKLGLHRRNAPLNGNQ